MKAKVVIVGGGVIGASCLYHLAEKGITDAVLFEKDSYGNGSTGKSAGIIESQYIDYEEIRIRVESEPLFRKFHEEDGLQLEENGYLRLGRSEEDREIFQKSVDIQHELGYEGAKVLTPEEIKELVPDMDLEGVHSGLFGPTSSYTDPYLATSIMVEKAKEKGAKAYQNTSVVDIKVKESGGFIVETEKQTVECDYVINAAGAWADKIGKMVGLDLPVKGYRRQVVVLDAPDIDYTVPSVMDYVPGVEEAGLYFREERGNKIFAGLHWESFGDDEDPVDPDNYKESVDSDYVEQLAEKLIEKVPGFTNLGFQNGWAGLYPLTPDTKPIVGEVKEVKGFINCIGFGGIGVQVSPIFGKAVADIVEKGHTNEIDLNRYSLYRFK